MGLTPVKEDGEDAYQRVIYNDVAQGAAWSQHKKWQHGRKQPRLTRAMRNSRKSPSPGRSPSHSVNRTLWSRHNSPSNGRKNKWESQDSRGVTIDNDEDMDITVIHNDVTYFYSRWVVVY